MKRKVFHRGNYVLSSLGLRSKGFFTPYDYIGSALWNVPPYPEVLESFRAKRSSFIEFIKAIAAEQPRFLQFHDGAPRPNWSTPFISRLDGAVIYTGIAQTRPRRLVEIGSGNSTKFILRAIADHQIDCEVTCIDPKPRIDIGAMQLRLERRVLSLSDLPLMEELCEGDVLFVDGSHILQQGFDVDIVLNRIFPRLKRGVVVHLHDIFLPFPYPNTWQAFHFNEQNALTGWLISGYFDTIFGSHYAYRELSEKVEELCADFPLITPENGGSLWMKKA